MVCISVRSIQSGQVINYLICGLLFLGDFVLPCQIRQPNSPQYSSSSSFRKGNNNVKSGRKYQKGYNNSSQLALPPTQKTQPFDFDSQQQTNSNGNNNNNYYLDTPADARHGMMQFSASAIASKIVRNMTMAMNGKIILQQLQKEFERFIC